MSVEYPFENCGYTRRRHSFRLGFKSAVDSLDCMRTEKTEMLTSVGKSPIPRAVVKKMKNRNPRADLHHHQ